MDNGQWTMDKNDPTLSCKRPTDSDKSFVL